MNIRKNSVSADWATVPGWDGAKKEYVELDCERWITENKIREAGRENGEQEFPPSEAVLPDEMHNKIRAWVNQRGRGCHAAVSMYLVQQGTALELETKEGIAPIQHTVENLRDEGIVELTDRGTEDRTSLTQKERETREVWEDLAAFRKRANLARIAEYEERGTWWLWLIGILVIEVGLNAMMLADVHELGLLGAMTTMLMIAVVNAGLLGGLIGEGWRQKNSVWPGPMVGGWVMVSIGAMGVPAWNLFVGHFRDSMLAVATKAARGASSLGDLLTDDTVDRFLNNPFGLESMASWLLAVIGVGACVLSATKWLKRDDVYPGYGPRYRTAIEQNEEYVQEVEQRRKNLRNSYKQYIGLIRDERLKVENKKGNHRLITDTAREIVRQFPMQLRQYQDHLDFIIGAYRDGNKKARTTPSPAFFRRETPYRSGDAGSPGME